MVFNLLQIKKNTSPWFGGSGGNLRNITLPDGLAIVGIKGKSSNLVNQLTFRIKVVSTN